MRAKFAEAVTKIFTRIFEIDYRSLRLFTIAIGIATLWDSVVRFSSIEAFYSSSGILSDSFINEVYADRFVWSLNLLNRSIAFQQMLFLTQAALSITLLLGVHRPLMNFLLWILVVSRHVANPYTLSAGDELLRFLLFWSCFIPVPAKAGTQFSIGGLALGIQILSVYYFSAVMKTGAPWKIDGSAISLAFKIESFSLPFARESLLKFPETLRFLTFSTLYLEVFAPLIFVVTGFFGFARLAFVSAMIVFHLALAATFRLGYFPFVCIAGWSLWIPSIFWQRVSSPLLAISSNTKNSNSFLSKFLAGLCLYLSIFTLGINFNTSQEKPFHSGLYLGSLGNFLQLWQKWGMFSPMPSVDDGWNQFEGILKDGSRVLINGYGGTKDGEVLANPLRDIRPVDLGAVYQSAGWKKFLFSLHQEDTTDQLRKSYLDYLCRKTKQSNPKLDLNRIDFIYSVEWTKPNLTKMDAIKVPILTYDCP